MAPKKTHTNSVGTTQSVCSMVYTLTRFRGQSPIDGGWASTIGNLLSWNSHTAHTHISRKKMIGDPHECRTEIEIADDGLLLGCGCGWSKCSLGQNRYYSHQVCLDTRCRVTYLQHQNAPVSGVSVSEGPAKCAQISVISACEWRKKYSSHPKNL